MKSRVFLSYVFEDHFYRDQVAGWADNGLLGDVEIVFERDDLRAKGESAIWAHLRPIMRSADAVVALVGQDTHSRRWVDEEIHYCASAGKALLWSRLPGTTGAAPIELRSRPPVAYQASALKEALALALRQIRK